MLDVGIDVFGCMEVRRNYLMLVQLHTGLSCSIKASDERDTNPTPYISPCNPYIIPIEPCVLYPAPTQGVQICANMAGTDRVSARARPE